MSIAYSPVWHHRLWRWLYSLFLLVLLPLALLKLWRQQSSAPATEASRWRERLGFVPKNFACGGIVVHCVSVGEVVAATGMIRALQDKYPTLPITVTSTSRTGSEQTLSTFGDSVQHMYLPIDMPLCVSHFIKRLKPKLLLVVEVEIWPNLLHQLYKRKVPAVLVNARMSAKSVSNYHSLSLLFRPALRKFSHICVQSPTDFDNFLSLGVYKSNLVLSNNLKFDIHLDPKDEGLHTQLQQDFALKGRRILLGASTHEGEELALINCYQTLKLDFPDLLLVIVPRYPQRFDEVAQLCNANGLHTQRASAGANAGKQALDILLVDKMGWLKACYQASNIAFVGGSFYPKGGHNALEAALYQLPIIMGPSIYNNPIICRALVEKGALTLLQEPEELSAQCRKLLLEPEQAKASGKRGYEVIEENAGALKVSLAVIQTYLG